MSTEVENAVEKPLEKEAVNMKEKAGPEEMATAKKMDKPKEKTADEMVTEKKKAM